MGFNCAGAGYKSCVKMVQAMVRTRITNSPAWWDFSKPTDWRKSSLKKDWAGFARMYNGPSYWQNRYDVKLAEQFQRFASGSVPHLEMRTAQVALLFLGYAPGRIDGIIGPRTRAAIKNFRIAADLPASEELDGPTYQALCMKAGIRP